MASAIVFYKIPQNKYWIFKIEHRQSQRINDAIDKVCIITEKSGKIRSSHYTCTADMGQSCNHVAATMYRIQAAVNIPFCTNTKNQCFRRPIHDI